MKKQLTSQNSPEIADPSVLTQLRPKRIMRIEDVENAVGFKRAYIYRLIRQNKFPQRIRIGIRAVGWDSDSIHAWIEERSNAPLY